MQFRKFIGLGIYYMGFVEALVVVGLVVLSFYMLEKRRKKKNPQKRRKKKKDNRKMKLKNFQIYLKESNSGFLVRV
jgi:heme/copper-type cytochrome/quinol oxidase subunit 2